VGELPSAIFRPVQSFEHELLRLLNEIPDWEVACRGGRHRFPLDDAVPGRKLPKGVGARPARDGCYQVAERCPKCQTLRVWLTLPGGRLDASVQYRYVYPPEWVKVPREFGVGRRSFLQEKYRRLHDDLSAVIRNADMAAFEPASQHIPPVVFSPAADGVL
jgi:hypothetical protein